MNTEEILSTFARFAYDELGTDMDAIDALQNDIERLKAGQLTFKPLIKQLISLCNEYELKETYNIVMSFHSKPKVNETLDFARWKILNEENKRFNRWAHSKNISDMEKFLDEADEMNLSYDYGLAGDNSAEFAGLDNAESKKLDELAKKHPNIWVDDPDNM